MTPQPNSRPQIKSTQSRVQGMAVTQIKKTRPTIKKQGHTKVITNRGGPPLGSENKFRGKLVKNALLNALAKHGRGDRMAALEKMSSKMIELALVGSIPAFREVADRIDGKPAQMIIGDPEQPITFKNVSEMSDEELEVLARGHLIQGEGRRV